MSDITLLAALITGLLGSVHCVGMCGGIVGSLTVELKKNNNNPLGFIFLYNLGRIISYMFAGILIASIGESSSNLFSQNAQQIGTWLSSVFMILLGLYIAGWWKLLALLETAGSHLWQYIQPFSNKLLPIKSYSQAFMLGALWGWLPCGMVYAMLVFALSSQDAVQGGLIMLAFGLGTLPTLLMLGTVSMTAKRFLQQSLIRHTAGILIILFGIYGLVETNAHEHHQGENTQIQH